MALPDNSMNPESLDHSAGSVCQQSVPPGFWQHHNANVAGLARSQSSQSLSALDYLLVCNTKACSSK